MSLVLGGGLLIGTTAQPVKAATFTVSNYSDDINLVGSLRWAIDQANNTTGADVIQFSVTGQILTTTPLLIPGIDNLTIAGPGSGQLTVSLQGNDGSVFDIFQNGGSGEVTISGLTITGGNAGGAYDSNGGGIRMDSMARVELDDVVITGNSADGNGGGIWSTETTLIIRNSVISSNSSSAGSAILHSWTGDDGASRLEIHNTTITANTPSASGAPVVYIAGNSNNRTSIFDSTISANTLGDSSGTILYGSNSGSHRIERTTVANNVGGNTGGGIYVQDGVQLNVVDSTISGHAVSNTAGGIWSTGDLYIFGSTISNNSAVNSGGGIYTGGGGNLEIVNSTISGNSVTGGTGGGLYIGSNNTLLLFVTVANNTASGNGDGVLLSGPSELTNVLFANNGDNNCTVFAAPNPAVGNLSTDATCSPYATQIADALIGPLTNNGGPTFTHALLDGSPAIENADCADTDYDQRNAPRPNPGTDCDTGAFERGQFDLVAPACEVQTGFQAQGDIEAHREDGCLIVVKHAPAAGPNETFEFQYEVTPGMPSGPELAALGHEEVLDFALGGLANTTYRIEENPDQDVWDIESIDCDGAGVSFQYTGFGEVVVTYLGDDGENLPWAVCIFTNVPLSDDDDDDDDDRPVHSPTATKSPTPTRTPVVVPEDSGFPFSGTPAPVLEIFLTQQAAQATATPTPASVQPPSQIRPPSTGSAGLKP